MASYGEVPRFCYRPPGGELQGEHGEFDGPKMYARTKRAEVTLAGLWAEQLADAGVAAHSMPDGES